MVMHIQAKAFAGTRGGTIWNKTISDFYIFYCKTDCSTKNFIVVLGFYVPPTAKVIRRRDLGLKSHSKDWRSPGSNSGPLVYKAGSLTARPRRLPTQNFTSPKYLIWKTISIIIRYLSQDSYTVKKRTVGRL